KDKTDRPRLLDGSRHDLWTEFPHSYICSGTPLPRMWVLRLSRRVVSCSSYQPSHPSSARKLSPAAMASTWSDRRMERPSGTSTKPARPVSKRPLRLQRGLSPQTERRPLTNALGG